MISSLLGVLAALPNRTIKWAIHGFFELFRWIPLVVNVFFAFFGVPLLGLDLPAVRCREGRTVAGGGADDTVNVAGGLNSVPPHQWKSATALSLRR